MSIYQNIEKSKQLAADVEAFLAKQKPIEVPADLDSDIPSGYVVLPPSFTKFPDGNLPRGYDRVVEEKPKPVKEPEEPKPKKPRVARPRAIKPKPPKISKKEIKANRLKVQQDLLVPFYEKASVADRQKLCQLVGVPVVTMSLAKKWKILSDETVDLIRKTLENFEYTIKPKRVYKPRKRNETTRWNEINDARKNAIARGEKYFTATCATHGETEYAVTSGNTSRCVECRREHNRDWHKTKLQSPEKREKFKRQSKNNAAMKISVEAGLRYFDGTCEKHGKQKFNVYPKKTKIGNSYPYQYKCACCKDEYSLKFREQRKAAREKVKAGLSID